VRDRRRLRKATLGLAGNNGCSSASLRSLKVVLLHGAGCLVAGQQAPLWSSLVPVLHRYCWQIATGVWFTSASVLAQVTDWPPPAPPLTTNQQHCSRRDMCPAGISCNTSLAGTEPSPKFRVCADKAKVRGYVSRCFYPYEGGIMHSVLFCPRGQTGAWPGSVAIAKAELEPSEAGAPSATNVEPPPIPPEVTADARPGSSPSTKDADTEHSASRANPVSHPPQKSRTPSCRASRVNASDEPFSLAFPSLALVLGALRRKVH